jgi:hypothetical protein
MRDNFNQQTKEIIAKQAAYLCSNPDCRAPTVGAALGSDGVQIVGVASHITAASVGGPRHDPSMTPADRRHHTNGIWLCQTHSKLVDGDDKTFPVDLLRKWKQDAKEQSFEALLKPNARPVARIEGVDAAVEKLISTLGLPAQDDLESVLGRLHASADTDLAAFRRMAGWPQHPVALNLKMIEDGKQRPFQASGLATAINSFNEIAVIAPPGTGKTTTLLQVTQAIQSTTDSVAVFIPLGEWSSRPESLLGTIVRRAAFTQVRKPHLMLLAYRGRLVLALDGWNELDTAARKRATSDIRQLQREFPLLGIIISTRRRALDIPIAGPIVEIDLLSFDQQIEIARALRGAAGEAMIEEARRIAGVRELIAIPLYLTALLSRAPGGAMPTTKEEVLRLFAIQHEESPEKATTLRDSLFDCQRAFLTAIASDATRSANTALTEIRAKSVVKAIEDELSAAGHFTIAPQPTAVLDLLVDHHTLVRSNDVLSFQHQQFQEWYASFEVERMMQAAATDDAAALRTLRVEMLNQPAWEEAVLFACERRSRQNAGGTSTVAAAVMVALKIDPILAADMIFRSSPDVWEAVKDRVIAFVNRWHKPGQVDRAVRFMITTGKPDFSEIIWPLMLHEDVHGHPGVVRAARRFRPSVLGAGITVRMAAASEVVRKAVISDIASRSGLDGIDLATQLAREDRSADAIFEVVQSLIFRRADRHVLEVLETAPPEVWSKLARKGYAQEVTDPGAAERIERERQRLIMSEPNPLARLGLLLEVQPPSPLDVDQISKIIAAPDFPLRDDGALYSIRRLAEKFPLDVANALKARLSAGLELPFRGEELLTELAPVDDGPIAALAKNLNCSDVIGNIAATLVGPKTVGELIDPLFDPELRVDRASPQFQSVMEQRRKMETRIASSRAGSLIQALLNRSTTSDPAEIGVLADLMMRHGRRGSSNEVISIDVDNGERVVALLRQWGATLAESTLSTRYQLAHVAAAMGRTGRPDFAPDLQRLLQEDQRRLQAGSDPSTGWTNWYRTAFQRIGGDETARILKDYLEDLSFGFDAACALMEIWKKSSGIPEPQPLWKSWPDFSTVKARLAERKASPDDETPFANAIFTAIEHLVAPGKTKEEHRLAIMLTRIALSMPHTERSSLIQTVLELPEPIRTKRELLAALVLDGETIAADLVLEGIKAWLDDAAVNTWRYEQGIWELVGWLELMPFSHRPAEIVGAVEAVSKVVPYTHELERVVTGLANAPGTGIEDVILQLIRRYPKLANHHTWAQAVLSQGNASVLLDLVEDGSLNGPGQVDSWWLSEQIAERCRLNPDFKAVVVRRYQSSIPGKSRELIELAASKIGDPALFMEMVRNYAASGRPFDGILDMAIREIGLAKEPTDGWNGAYDMHPVSLTTVRKELFSMLLASPPDASLAEACLLQIDQLRDDYGQAEFEPRHPDVESNRPWPTAADEPKVA